MCKECKYPEGFVIRPDGIHDLDPCIFEEDEVWKNVVVQILKCKRCGKISIGWYKTPNSIKVNSLEEALEGE